MEPPPPPPPPRAQAAPPPPPRAQAPSSSSSSSSSSPPPPPRRTLRVSPPRAQTAAREAAAAARAAKAAKAAKAARDAAAKAGGDGQVFEELVAYAATKLVANSVLAPFEVASVMYQVQYQPIQRDALGNAVGGGRATGNKDEDEDDEDDEDDDDGGGADKSTARRDGREDGGSNSTDPGSSTGLNVHRATPGYLAERSAPSMPTLHGVFHGVRALCNREGVFALWNGNLLQTWVDMSMLMVQPSVESVLNDVLGLDDTTPFELLERRWPNLFTILASHITTALILSPVQVLRIRLIVQKTAGNRAKYLGVRHGLLSIWREEGLAGWFRGLSATLLHAALVPFCQAIKPVLLLSVVGLRQESLAYVLGDFLLTTAQLALTFPVQTAQRRLQAQWTPVVRRGRQDRPFDPAVRLSALRYTGVADCILRVAREEGIGSLYRGFIYQWTGTVLVSLLSSFARLEEDVDVEQSGDSRRQQTERRAAASAAERPLQPLS